MFNRSLLVATLLVFSVSASSRAATMSSDAVDSDIFAPPVNSVLSDSSHLDEVKTDGFAYFTPVTEEGAGAKITTEKKEKHESALVGAATVLALGSFFTSNSDLPSVDLRSPVLVSSPEVAPVPELNSGVLVVLALGGLGAVGIGRRQLLKSQPSI